MFNQLYEEIILYFLMLLKIELKVCSSIAIIVFLFTLTTNLVSALRCLASLTFSKKLILIIIYVGGVKRITESIMVEIKSV